MTEFSVPLEVDLSPDEIFGYLACGLVLATFAMRSMQGLRYVAILSNVAFIYYAGALSLMPIFILHAILLPLNLWRLFEIWTEKAKPGADKTHDVTSVPPVAEEFHGSRTAAQLVIAASQGERRHGGESPGRRRGSQDHR